MQHEGNYDILFQLFFLTDQINLYFFIHFLNKPLDVKKDLVYKLFKKIDIIKKKLDIV